MSALTRADRSGELSWWMCSPKSRAWALRRSWVSLSRGFARVQHRAIQTPIAAQPKAKLVPVPAEEPSDSVLRQLMFEQYAQIEDAGGLPLTATASNTNFILRVKLYDARKESCAPAPQARAGTYNCSMTIKLAIAANKDPANARPYEKSERISVKWDPSGKWVRG